MSGTENVDEMTEMWTKNHEETLLAKTAWYKQSENNYFVWLLGRSLYWAACYWGQETWTRTDRVVAEHGHGANRREVKKRGRRRRPLFFFL